ncbi:DUF1684 domain-containing protein [Streptomyces hiroshimensis]|uniref:DUF1684 domain-containing protein n=1 Tax=Streptomyces hiroshimensis TaxID=66424 RepID=A0ABQ2Z3G3_9ACTN|nr:DUF1684 domain-containing protein [Streptomyces hiroshimensis]GGY00563.1 hypothetical protein GCM10010324_54140 [Streptomyces hiroshimensis]
MSTDTGNDARQQWKAWHEERTETVSAPYGPLALTGTYWIADATEGRIPAIPGHWAVDGENGERGGAVLLTATAADGLTVDGRPLSGTVRLTADKGPAAAARADHGGRKLVVIRREGLWAVRVYDPGSAGRRAFTAIDVFEYDEDWVSPGVFRPYDSRRRVSVRNADGRERGLGLDGELAFTAAGSGFTLQVGVEVDGTLWAVFADGTSGDGSYRFRFLRTPAPGVDGRVTVDFNRALLPPCAFADHFICPCPPPGNTLPIVVPAGERRVLLG